MQIDLGGRVAVITGGGRGIGKATAAVFAAAGAQVFVWDVDEVGGQAVAGEIDGKFQKVDVTDRLAVEAAVAEVVEAAGRLDILINNAGVIRDAQLVKFKEGELVEQMSEADFDAVFSVNVKGVFHCTQAVVPQMVAQGYGRILNASSIVGLYGNFGQTNYVAAKMGVIGMTKVWARELGKHGITANAVAPGFIETEMAMSVPEKILSGMVERTPVKRLGKPSEVADTYAFLASDRAGFINGAVISVDGGLVLGT
ncbi:MAG: 3-oxoacyl-ACP reductase FabG [Planctomycetota bacterium]|nr:3-oxoacyl-ACP reductase FabG [Planctomycetota bacterium]